MNFFDIMRILFDISLVTFIFYKILMVVQGTRSVQILKGVFVLLSIWVFSLLLGLEALNFILSQVILYGLLGLIIIFQPELRNALERLGRQNYIQIGASERNKVENKVIDDLVSSFSYMSKRRIGALISIEIEDSLEEYIKTGILLNADISEELLINIFSPNMPLHDGAMIIQKGKIVSASCYLPLSEDPTISKDLGTRHRAGIGMSEDTDALTLIVSEETGNISITRNSLFSRDLSLDEFRTHLELILNTNEDIKPRKVSLFRGFKIK